MKSYCQECFKIMVEPIRDYKNQVMIGPDIKLICADCAKEKYPIKSSK
jgi:hypothetical protein